MSNILPPSELGIIRLMWKIGHPVSAAELNAAIDRGWRVQTLITHLTRMEEKGLVVCKRGPTLNGVRCRYETTLTKDEYLRAEVDHMVERLRDLGLEITADAILSAGTLRVEE